MRYTKNEVIVKLHEAVTANKPLYHEKCVNYLSNDKETGQKHTESIAEYLLVNQKALNSGIKPVTRKASYDKAHTGKTKQYEKLSHQEERIALWMFINQKKYPLIGQIIDYQIPLRDTDNDKLLRAFDLLSYSEETDTLYMIELKRPESKDTLLKAFLEIYAYWKTVNHLKLKKDFGHESAKLIPAVMVFEKWRINQQCDNAITKDLMKHLGVQFTILTDDDASEIILTKH